MKYIVLLCDGMADLPCDELGGMTPMQKAKKPHMDALARKSHVGMVKTVADGLKPGSDVANLSVMGYDPLKCYTGRSPLEAASIGIDMQADDVAIRCNLVTLSDGGEYRNKTILDYCADDISTEEADELIHAVQDALGNEMFSFYTGVSYRHCLIWHGGEDKGYTLTPPHDITGRVITEYLCADKSAAPLLALMERSFAVLEQHPINQKRRDRGLRPANSIWLWGQGKRPTLACFKEKFGVKGAVVSAVDLIKGIGKCTKMEVVEVAGATGYIDTNFEGKADAALKALRNGNDFVYIHVEAPDECGHRREYENKVKSIELIDERVLARVLDGLAEYDDFRLMILPDHPTPLSIATHTSAPVPFLLYQKCEPYSGVSCFCEQTASETGLYIDHGPDIMKLFLNRN